MVRVSYLAPILINFEEKDSTCDVAVPQGAHLVEEKISQLFFFSNIFEWFVQHYGSYT